MTRQEYELMSRDISTYGPHRLFQTSRYVC